MPQLTLPIVIKYQPLLLEQSFILNDEPESKYLAQQIAQSIIKGDIYLFEGNIGAGKTFICRSIIQSLFNQNIAVPSPTFTILQSYKLPDFSIYHYDLYRLKHADELWELGIEEAFSNNICLIEWPELIEKTTPKPYRKIYLEVLSADQRKCTITYIFE